MIGYVKLCILLIVLSNLCTAEDCLAPDITGFNDTEFYNTPNTQAQLLQCQEFNNNSCCTRNYTSEIAAMADPISLSILEVIRIPISSCKSKLQDISCIMCSPYQYQWISLYNNVWTLTICKSFCEELYNNCAGQETTELVPITRAFNSSGEFCAQLFSGLQNSTVALEVNIEEDSPSCWSNRPECTENNYISNLTECINGKQNLIWYPKLDAPCIFGVSQPENIYNIPCGTHCGPGEYFSTYINSCMNASEGYYSIGNGLKITSWTVLDEMFFNHGWTGTENQIQASTEDNILVLSTNLVSNGTMKLKYSVENQRSETSGLYIVLNNEELPGVPFNSTQHLLQSLEIQLPQGHNTIQFHFEGFSNFPFRTAAITELLLLGTVQAALSPTPCPPGTYSPKSGSSECITCNWNTYSSAGASSCQPCSSNEYAFPGSSSCTIREPCTEEDYKEFFTPCNNSKQKSYYKQTNPTCIQTEAFIPRNRSLTECLPCPLGSYRSENSDNCEYCPIGEYWSEVSRQCKISFAGSAAILHKSYVTNPVAEESFPSEFSTGCSGDCLCGNNKECSGDGWVFSQTYAHSGINEARSLTTYLDLNISLVNNGSLRFDFLQLGYELNGFFLYLNERPTPLPDYYSGDYKTALFDLEMGMNHIRWVYVQESGAPGEIRLKNIIIEGAGGATEETEAPPGYYTDKNASSYFLPCPAGEFSSQLGQSNCELCSTDEFSPFSGSTECIACGSGTTATGSHSSCTMDLVFELDNFLFDFTRLQGAHGPIIIPSVFNGDNILSRSLWIHPVSQATCVDGKGNEVETYLCQVNSQGVGEAIGNRLSVEKMQLGASESDFGILLSYDCVGMEKNCNTSILVVCDENAKQSEPFFLEIPTEEYNYKLRWDTVIGCGECIEETFVRQILSDCEDGNRSITTVYSGNCGLPVNDSFTEIQACSTEWVYEVGLFQVMVGLLCVLLICVLLFVFLVLIGFLVLKRPYSIVPQSEPTVEVEMEEITPQEIATDDKP